MKILKINNNNEPAPKWWSDFWWTTIPSNSSAAAVNCALHDELKNYNAKFYYGQSKKRKGEIDKRSTYSTLDNSRWIKFEDEKDYMLFVLRWVK